VEFANVLEFNTMAQHSQVCESIMREPDGKLLLFCKSADSVISSV